MVTRFEQFLAGKGSIGQKQIPYYVKWITDCYATCNCPPDKLLPAEQKKRFLEQLQSTREEWQVKQTDQALRLYTFFISRHSHRPPATSFDAMGAGSGEND